VNYNNYHAVFTNKVKGYSYNTCMRAMQDCYDTLKIQGDGIDPDYSNKLWAEIDALRNRQMTITRSRS
jgi:hypothetical protein